MHTYIHTRIFVGGGSETSANPSDQFVHKPGPGIPTSSTPNQQPALAMPRFGERATSGPEALSGGGHTPYQSSAIREFSPLDRSCDITQYEHKQNSIHPGTEESPPSLTEGNINTSCCPRGAQH